MIDYRRYAAMRHTADCLISDALEGRSPQWPYLAKHEPSAVQAVTIGGVSQLAAAWSHILRPLGLVVTTHAVFCHSSPQVDFVLSGTTKPPVELADLLVVVDVARSGGTRRRARLIQAKVAKPNGGILLNAGKEQVQLALLTAWPPFQFTALAYSKTWWNLRHPSCPGRFDQSGRYGGIDDDLTSWRQIIPGSLMTLVGWPSLGDEITRMAFDMGGRSAHIAGGDPWSDLIHELMHVTYSSVYGRSHPHQRGHTSTSQFVSANLGSRSLGATTVAWESFPGSPSADGLTEMPDGPISVVHLTISTPEDAPSLAMADEG